MNGEHDMWVRFVKWIQVVRLRVVRRLAGWGRREPHVERGSSFSCLAYFSCFYCPPLLAMPVLPACRAGRSCSCHSACRHVRAGTRNGKGAARSGGGCCCYLAGHRCRRRHRLPLPINGVRGARSGTRTHLERLRSVIGSTYTFH